jgi:hypothetical protein
MNQLELGWLIGIIDGEGCLTIRCRRNKTKTLGERLGFYCQLVVANTDEKMIHRLKELTGMGRVYHRDRKQPSRRQFIWEISSNGLRALIPLIEDYSTKKDEIQIIKRVLEIISVRRIRPSGSGSFRTDEELHELFNLRVSLLDLHGLQAKKLAKFTEWSEAWGSPPLKVARYQVAGDTS